MKLRLIPLAMVAVLAFASCKDKLTGPLSSSIKTLSINDTLALYPHPLVNGMDVSGNGHNGTLTTSGHVPVSGWDRFKQDSLVSYGPITVTNTSGLDFTDSDSYTVSAWFEGFGGFGPIPVVSLPTGCKIEIWSSSNSDQVNLIHFDSTATVDTAAGYTNVDSTLWHMVTVVVNPKARYPFGLSIYIDSQLVGVGDAGTMAPSPQAYFPMYLGYEGILVDDIIIVDSAEPASWVSSRYHEGGWEVKQPVIPINPHPGWVQDSASLYPGFLTEAVTGLCWTSPAVGFFTTDHGEIYNTSDSGVTWNYANDLPEIVFGISSLDGINVITGCGVGGSAVFYSNNTGGGWNSFPLTGTAQFHTCDAKYFDATHAIAVGGVEQSGSKLGIVYLSSDGGVTWTQEANSFSEILTSIAILPNGDGLCTIVGDSGQIFRSNDFGITWTNESQSGVNFLSVDFATNSNGMTVTDNGSVYTTSNGGSSWALEASGIASELSAVKMVSSTEAWTAGAAGAIRHTTDGGTTWANENISGVIDQWNEIGIRDGHHILFAGEKADLWWRVE
jgi:photosystem II stability/assembly factor-like uncharacterized protein